MALTDLKRKVEKQSKADTPKVIGSSNTEERPYCLRFTLESPELEKLGLKPQDFSEMEPIEATVLVDPINIRDIQSKSTDDWDKNRNQSVELQIMGISFGAMTKKKASKFAGYKNEKEKGPTE